MTAEDAARELGLFAAVCDVYAADWRLSWWERMQLNIRAQHYRDLQAMMLADVPEVEHPVERAVAPGIVKRWLKR